jgi:hypothetical protein
MSPVGVKQGYKKGTLAPLTFFCFKASMGRCVINVPSTTGTKTYVPKNPLLATLLFTIWRALASAPRRQARESRANEQLFKYREYTYIERDFEIHLVCATTSL